MNATLIGHMGTFSLFGHHMTVVWWPGLFALIAVLVLLRVLRRRGRIGPVRFAPRRGDDAAQPTAEDAALTLLKQRLAKGDITPEEYLHRSSVLRTDPPAAH